MPSEVISSGERQLSLSTQTSSCQACTSPPRKYFFDIIALIQINGSIRFDLKRFKVRQKLSGLNGEMSLSKHFPTKDRPTSY